eukprot:XP_015580546.1 elicitor peptide 6 [Ricinus communis]
METSSATVEEQRRGEEEEENYNILYSPCYFCQKFVKSILKCLGYDHSTRADQSFGTPAPHRQAEQRMKINEDKSRAVVQSSRSAPPPPPVSGGVGGQIN